MSRTTRSNSEEPDHRGDVLTLTPAMWIDLPDTDPPMQVFLKGKFQTRAGAMDIHRNGGPERYTDPLGGWQVPGGGRCFVRQRPDHPTVNPTAAVPPAAVPPAAEPETTA